MLKRLVLPLALFMASAAWAEPLTIRLCGLDRPFSPFVMPDGSGSFQKILARVADPRGIVIEEEHTPWSRCLSRLETGETDAVFGAFLPQRLAFAAYPMADGHPDTRRALATVRFKVYRRRGDTVGWDGRTFQNLGDQTVAVQLGFSLITQLRELGVAIDDSAPTTEQNLGKLVLNRVGAVVAMEDEAEPILAKQFAGQIESLPTPFQLTPLFLIVNRRFYETHRSTLEELWTAIGKARA